MGNVHIPTQEELVEILKQEEFCRSVAEMVGIDATNKEAGFLMSLSLESGILNYKVRKGKEYWAPDIYPPPKHLELIRLHSHPDSQIRGYVSPNGMDIRLSLAGPLIGKLSLQTIECLEHRSSVAPESYILSPKDQAFISEKESELDWFSELGGVVDGVVGIVLYQRPFEKKERMLMIERFDRGYGTDIAEVEGRRMNVGGDFECQNDVLSALKIASPFSAFLRYKTDGQTYKPID